MSRRTLNLAALAVVALGGTALARPQDAAADVGFVKCTRTVTYPDGTTVTTVVEGTSCTVDTSGNCRCTN